MNRCLFWKIWTTGAILLFFGATILTASHETTFEITAGYTVYVNDDNTSGPWDGSLANPYQNITSGLAHASNGDTILVLSGTYPENVAINKSVELKGDSNPTINGRGGVGINIATDNITVNGFSITNSSYGIYCTNASGFTLANNNFSDNGNGLHWKINQTNLTSDYTIFDSTIRDNEFSMNNNAIYVSIGLNYTDTGFHNVNIGSIMISNNTLHMQGTQAYGIRVSTISVENLYGGKISIATLNMSANKVYGGGQAIDFNGNLAGTRGRVLEHVQASVGDLIINNNIMTNQSGLTASALSVNGYRAIGWAGNTTGTFGDLVIRGNTITSNQNIDAINIHNYAYSYNFSGNAKHQAGNLYIEENQIDVGSEGIHVQYGEARNLRDHASITLQNTYLRNNTIHGSNTGIYLDLEDLRDLFNSSSYTMKNIIIEGNAVNSSNDGVYIYGNYVGYDMFDNSTILLGNFTINDNTITSGNYGVYYFLYDFGHELHGNSSFIMGSLRTNHNNISSSRDAVYVNVLYFGYIMYGDSSFTIGNIELNNNTISGSNGITLHQIEWTGSTLYGNSSFTMNNLEVRGNTIKSIDRGVYVYSIYNIGYLLYENSRFTIGDFLVNNNAISEGNDGINVAYLKLSSDQVYDRATSTRGNIEFSHNSIANSSSGIVLANLDNATVKNNVIQDCSVGINMLTSHDNRIYHNNLNSTINVQDNGANTWDNGYDGGNWWSNYNGVDLQSGPAQDQPESDGIGDTAYTISANSTDNYPLMGPFYTFNAGTWNNTVYNVDIVSQSTITSFNFDADNMTITCTIEGQTGTVGFCRVTVPKSLLWNDNPDEWTVKIDNVLTQPNITEYGNNTYIYFVYIHSMHQVQIKGTHAVPEVVSPLTVTLLLLIVLSAILTHRKKLSSKRDP